MVFDKNYYEFFMKNKMKFDQYEVIALQRVIKHYNNAFELLKICENYKYDFKLRNNMRFEVKAEPYSLKSGNAFVEYFDNYNQKPSGISTTLAEYYILTDTLDNYYMIETVKLNLLCKTNPSRVNGFKTAIGYIVPLHAIIAQSIAI